MAGPEFMAKEDAGGPPAKSDKWRATAERFDPLTAEDT